MSFQSYDNKLLEKDILLEGSKQSTPVTDNLWTVKEKTILMGPGFKKHFWNAARLDRYISLPATWILPSPNTLLPNSGSRLMKQLENSDLFINTTQKVFKENIMLHT